MKIAFTAKGTEWESQMDARFGRTEYFLFYDEESKELKSYDNKNTAMEAHGAGPKAAKIIFDNGVNILITGNGPGGNAETILQKTGIKTYIGAGNMSVKEAYDSYKSGNLESV